MKTDIITKKQHYIPQFYLRQWIKEDNKIDTFDIKEQRNYYSFPESIMVKKFFYESKNFEVNEIEKFLCSFEENFSFFLIKINEILNAKIKNVNSSVPERIKKFFLERIDDESLTMIKAFIIIQLIRTKGFKEQKEYEFMLDEDKINMGELVKDGYFYLKKRFSDLFVITLIDYSKSNLLLTSDWPCSEIQHDNQSIVAGEQIGVDSNVSAIFIGTPNIVFQLCHKNYVERIFEKEVATNSKNRKYRRKNKNKVRIPTNIVSELNKSIIEDYNFLTVQQADRFLILPPDFEKEKLNRYLKTRKKK